MRLHNMAAARLALGGLVRYNKSDQRSNDDDHQNAMTAKSPRANEVWCAKRIQTPDPRITNSEILVVSHINQCLAKDKRGLSL
jgi:hypothetical protein